MRPRFRTITLVANNDPSLNPNTALEFKGYKRLKFCNMEVDQVKRVSN